MAVWSPVTGSLAVYVLPERGQKAAHSSSSLEVVMMVVVVVTILMRTIPLLAMLILTMMI